MFPVTGYSASPAVILVSLNLIHFLDPNLNCELSGEDLCSFATLTNTYIPEISPFFLHLYAGLLL